MKTKVFLLCGLISFAISTTSCGGSNETAKESTGSEKTDSLNYEQVEDTPSLSVESPLCPNTSMFLMDASVSVKPYLDGGDPNFPAVVSEYINLVEGSSIHLFTDKKQNLQTTNEFNQDLLNKSIKWSAVSNFDSMIEEMLKSTNSKDVSILLTDGIMSGTNEQIRGNSEYNKQYREWMANEIKKKFSKTNGLSAIVVRYDAKFKGTYYCYNNSKVNLDCNRPYYIIAIGPWKYIKYIEQKLADTDSNDALTKPYTNYVMFGDQESYDKLKFSYNKGVARVENNKWVLEGDVKKGKDSLVISASVKELPDYMRSEEYWSKNLTAKINDCVVANFTISSDYNKERILVSLPGQQLNHRESLTLTLDYAKPKWISAYTDEEDLQIGANAIKQGQTFNLKYFVEGLSAIQKNTTIKSQTLKFK